MKKFIYAVALMSIFGLAQQTPAKKQLKSVLIKGGTAHIGNGQVISNAAILFENGKITSIEVDNGSLKADMTIDAKDMHIYPGFIAPNATLGLVEIDAVRSTDDEAEVGTFNPHIRSIIAYNAESKIVESVRPSGVLLAQITPRGGRIAGTSSVVQLDAWNWEDAVVRENDGIHMRWPNMYQRTGWWAEPGGVEPNKKYDEQTTTIQTFFENSFAYLMAKPAVKDVVYAGMSGLQTGEKTLYITADGEKEIIDAINFKIKNKFQKLTIIGGHYAYKVANMLKENNVSVLLRRVHSLPFTEDEDVNLPFKNAKLLSEKGILVGLQNEGDMERMQTRNLPFYAGTCATWGLDKEKALQLITSNTAKILGIDANYGTLEKGKSATLFISSGDALDMRTNNVQKAYIDGREISLESRHTELYQRYKGKYESK